MNYIIDVFSLLATNKDFFIKLTIEHLAICAVSVLIAIVLGLFLGILISSHKKFAPFVLSITNIIYTIPAISLLGLLLPFSGIGNKTAIIALSVYALLPMVRNTYVGIEGVDADVLEAAKGMGSTSMQLLYKIKLPLAARVIVSGIRNMVVMTIALAGIASFVGAGGLGVAIYRGITTNNMIMTTAGSLLIAIIAFAADILIGLVVKQFTIEKKEKVVQKRFAVWIASLVVFVLVVSFFMPKEKGTINIASKPMTEQLILTEILSQIIENDTGINVEITKGVGGGTSNIMPPLLSGEFDMYPEYTGTGWSFVLKKEDIPDEETLQTELEKEYEDNYNLSWVGYYGFNNTYGLAVRSDIADEYNLNTYSDLAAISDQLTFGAEYDFYEREDGYDELCENYGFDFKKEVDIDIGLKYNAINNKQIDVMNIFTTDGQLSVSHIKVLEDDLSFYQNYYCGSVVRDDTLEKYPMLRDSLMKMDNLISEDEMARLNYLVDGEHQNEYDVAKDFLEQNNILK